MRRRSISYWIDSCPSQVPIRSGQLIHVQEFNSKSMIACTCCLSNGPQNEVESFLLKLHKVISRQDHHSDDYIRHGDVVYASCSRNSNHVLRGNTLTKVASWTTSDGIMDRKAQFVITINSRARHFDDLQNLVLRPSTPFQLQSVYWKNCKIGKVKESDAPKASNKLRWRKGDTTGMLALGNPAR